MNLFLTGQRQVGKSTALRLALAQSGLRAAGLCSVFGPAEPEGGRALYLCPYGGAPVFDPAYVCARMGPAGRQPHPAVFDEQGSALVETALLDPAVQVLVIDELGFLEAEAARFRAAVLAALNGPKPVVGVVRQGLGAWGDVDLGTLWQVTPENRDALPPRLLRWLRDAL